MTHIEIQLDALEKQICTILQRASLYLDDGVVNTLRSMYECIKVIHESAKSEREQRRDNEWIERYTK